MPVKVVEAPFLLKIKLRKNDTRLSDTEVSAAVTTKSLNKGGRWGQSELRASEREGLRPSVSHSTDLAVLLHL